MAARGARQHLVMESLGPAPVRVACVDAGDSLWAWQWEDAFAHERGGFPGDHGPWSGRGDTLSDPPRGLRRSSSTTTTSASVTTTLTDPLQVFVCVRAYVYVYVIV